MKFFADFDTTVTLCSVLLLSISLVILSSIEFSLFQNQLLFALLGVLCFFFFSSITIRPLRNFSLAFYLLSIFLLLILLFVGIEVRGARRWIDFIGFRVQFSEVIKPFLVMAFASLLSNWEENLTLRRIILSCVFLLPVFILLLRQPDLGSALIYSFTFVFMLVSGGMSIWYLVSLGFVLVLVFPLIWKVLAEYQRNRILAFMNPRQDPLGIGYNAIQSAIAVGSGLLFGRGLGRGVQSQLQFLPERHTDFIFASFSEEFGFLGTLVVLLLFFILLRRILQIANTTSDSFESFTTLGVFAILLSQVFINIGMNLGILPITGVTLPLISYGGSSIISTMILLGIVNGIHRNISKKENTLEIR